MLFCQPLTFFKKFFQNENSLDPYHGPSGNNFERGNHSLAQFNLLIPNTYIKACLKQTLKNGQSKNPYDRW